MLSSRRCGATTRAGNPCLSPAVGGKNRCRMHGGAAGSGAPRGNRNALKHGLFARAATDEARRDAQELVQRSLRLVREIETKLP